MSLKDPGMKSWAVFTRAFFHFKNAILIIILSRYRSLLEDFVKMGAQANASLTKQVPLSEQLLRQRVGKKKKTPDGSEGDPPFSF